jgi:hypothetical protein
MSDHNSFIEFCRSLITEDIDEVDIELVLSFYVSYIEPFCDKNNIELPIDVIEYFSSLYDVMNDSEDDSATESKEETEENSEEDISC